MKSMEAVPARGHLPSLMVGRYPTVLHRDSDLVGADN
jgi:hypothetical protein